MIDNKNIINVDMRIARKCSQTVIVLNTLRYKLSATNFIVENTAQNT